MTKKIVLSLLSMIIVCIALFFWVYKDESASDNKSDIDIVSGTATVNNIQFKVLKDKADQYDLSASFYYEALTSTSIDTDTYYWENKKLIKSPDTYRPTYANKYSIQSVDNLQKRMGLSDSPVKLFGQLYFYGEGQNYELFIFDSSRTGSSEWRVVFLSDASFKEVVVKKDLDEVRLDSYQISEDAVYLYTRSKNENSSDIVFYKINTDTYEVAKTVVPLSKFDVNKVIVQLDKIFVNNDELLIDSSSFDEVFDGRGVILRYNLATNISQTDFVEHTIHKVIPYKDQYLVVADEKDSFKPVIKYYDQNFKLIKTAEISVDSEYGDPVIGARDYFFSLKNDRLYGTLSVDGISNINYLVVLDAENAEILYLAEISFQKRGYLLQDARFHQNVKGKFIDIIPF
ncbi:hypothetical protein NST84_23150 [Paenibacillus sp. FSL R7-0345]|uniref:hypothetical protein n=1 Tax=Paenibacillus sp. FSL R7-0345 TaxID=2954535 RepID=UPI00315ABE70